MRVVFLNDLESRQFPASVTPGLHRRLVPLILLPLRSTGYRSPLRLAVVNKLVMEDMLEDEVKVWINPPNMGFLTSCILFGLRCVVLCPCCASSLCVCYSRRERAGSIDALRFVSHIHTSYCSFFAQGLHLCYWKFRMTVQLFSRHTND